MISRRALIIGAAATFVTRPALALPPSRCRGPFNARKIGPVNPQCLAVPQGLVGYWPLGADTTDFHQGLTFDISGNGNTGTMTGLSAASLAQGPVGTGLTFNGTSSSVTINPISSIIQTVSLSVWIKIATSGNLLIFTQGPSSNNANLIFAVSSQKAYIELYNGTDVTVSGNVVIQLNTWTHVVYCRNGVNGYIYVNGSLDASSGALPSFSIGVNRATLGSDFGSDTFMSGPILCACLYSRVLDPWEVKTLYQTGLAGSRTPWSAPRMIWR